MNFLIKSSQSKFLAKDFRLQFPLPVAGVLRPERQCPKIGARCDGGGRPCNDYGPKDSHDSSTAPSEPATAKPG